MDVPSAKAKASVKAIRHLGDFTTDPRVLIIAGISVIVASAGVITGVILLKLIRLATNIAYFGQFNLAELNSEIRRLAYGPCWSRSPAR